MDIQELFGKRHATAALHLSNAVREGLDAYLARCYEPPEHGEHLVPEAAAPMFMADQLAETEASAPIEAPALGTVTHAAPTLRHAPKPSVPCPAGPPHLNKLLGELDEPFSTTLLAIIDARGYTDAEVYRRAHMSRQHFSKIRSNPGYRPTKRTVLALCVALELDIDDASLLLKRAGFALSHADKTDVIVEYFLKNGPRDLMLVNEALYAYDEPVLS